MNLIPAIVIVSAKKYKDINYKYSILDKTENIHVRIFMFSATLPSQTSNLCQFILKWIFAFVLLNRLAR